MLYRIIYSQGQDRWAVNKGISQCIQSVKLKMDKAKKKHSKKKNHSPLLVSGSQPSIITDPLTEKRSHRDRKSPITLKQVTAVVPRCLFPSRCMVILLGKGCCHRAQVYTDTWRPRRPPKRSMFSLLFEDFFLFVFSLQTLLFYNEPSCDFVRWWQLVVQLLSCIRLLQPHGVGPARLLCPWDFPSKNTGVGCHFLLQGIFPIRELNLGLLHRRQILYRLSYEGSPVILYVCVYSASDGQLYRHFIIHLSVLDNS